MLLSKLVVPAFAVLLAVFASTGVSQPLDAPGADSARASVKGAAPVLTAKLIDMERKAGKKEATVQAEVRNVTITDPAAAGEQAQPGQAHFHYQVDTGPVVATTVSKLSFHGLSPGPHLVTVTLAGNDHQPVAPPVVLPVRIP